MMNILHNLPPFYSKIRDLVYSIIW